MDGAGLPSSDYRPEGAERSVSPVSDGPGAAKAEELAAAEPAKAGEAPIEPAPISNRVAETPTTPEPAAPSLDKVTASDAANPAEVGATVETQNKSDIPAPQERPVDGLAAPAEKPATEEDPTRMKPEDLEGKLAETHATPTDQNPPVPEASVAQPSSETEMTAEPSQPASTETSAIPPVVTAEPEKVEPLQNPEKSENDYRLQFEKDLDGAEASLKRLREDIRNFPAISSVEALGGEVK